MIGGSNDSSGDAAALVDDTQNPRCSQAHPILVSLPSQQKRLGGALTMSHQEIKQDEIAAATHRTVAVVSRFFPALVRQQRKVASWSYVVVRQLYEEIIGPYGESARSI